ncbi:MAG: ferrous iron transporter B [Chloroflexi bacterium]|jgi:ferrous iron transport protein B|nr:ferrous iron transporter B [Chloroflexota bacterium]
MSQVESLRVTYDATIESAIKEIGPLLESTYSISKRSVALLFLQDDKDIRQLLEQDESARFARIDTIAKKTQSKYSHPLNYVIRMRLQREAEHIASSCITMEDAPEMPFREKLSRIMINPITGIPILLVILYLGLYQLVGVLGAGIMVDWIEGTLFGEHINPFFADLAEDYIPWQSIQDLIVGEYGILKLGLTYAIAIILPIVGIFFIVFSIIEDTGYLPRLSLLVDALFKKIGLSGRAVIPMVLGLGCDTMATMVTRTQETRRERVIATLLLALAIPCAAQLGVIMGIMSGHPKALITWVLVIVLSFILIGYLASKVLPGRKPSFYMELPPLRWPKLSNVLTKTYTRMIWYLKEVLPIFVLVSVIVWFMELVGAMDSILSGIEPLVNFIGLPDDTASVFLFGFFRRDYGAAGLFDMQDILTGVQLTVAAVTLTLFVPCIAQFMMMVKERGVKTAGSILVFIVVYAFGVGFLLNKILNGIGATL